MEQQADNYQIQYIPANANPTSGGGGNCQIIVGSGCFSKHSLVECAFSYTGTQYSQVLVRAECPVINVTNMTVTIDGKQRGQYVQNAAAQFCYYSHFCKEQKDIWGGKTSATDQAQLNQNVGKKQWRCVGIGTGASVVYYVTVPLHQFCPGVFDLEDGDKFRVFNQMTIQFSLGNAQGAAGLFCSESLTVNGAVVNGNAAGITTQTFAMYVKNYPNDPHQDQVLSCVSQQSFPSVLAVNSPFSVGANQISKWHALMIRSPYSTAANNTAINWDEAPVNITAFQYTKNTFNQLSLQNPGTVSNSELCAAFSLLANGHNLSQNNLVALFYQTYSNSLIQHVINLTVANNADFYFTYQFSEQNPMIQQANNAQGMIHN